MLFLILSLPGGTELIIIFLIVLLLFGAKKLPEVARGLGSSIREFKKATKGIREEIDTASMMEPEKKDEGTKAKD